jgi:haloacetate dehalogenase
MQKNFDIGAEWRKRCLHVSTASLPGGHFFIDQFPTETAQLLAEFLKT